jgi:hypothetical protein
MKLCPEKSQNKISGTLDLWRANGRKLSATLMRKVSRPATGESQMASKSDFTSEEWSRVLAAPMVASTAVTAADPSGLWGLLQEGVAGGRALLKAKQDTQANPLIKAVVNDFASGNAGPLARDRVQAIFNGAEISDVSRRAVDELRTIAPLLDAKAPEDAAAFKAWLQEVAQNAAEAATEGGFSGFGGVTVSDAEKATLAEISAALSSPSTTG